MKDTQEGYYWARYKDHGWHLIYVDVHDSGFKMIYDMSYVHFPEEIDEQYWYQYIDLRKIEEPEFGS